MSPHDQSFDAICYFNTQNTVDDGLVMNLRGGGGNVIELVESDSGTSDDDSDTSDDDCVIVGSGSDGSMDAKKKKRHKPKRALRALQKKLKDYCEGGSYEIPVVELVKRALTMTGGDVDLAYEAIVPDLKTKPTKKGKKKKQTVSNISSC